MNDHSGYVKVFQEIYDMVKPILGQEKALSWMHEKNPNLDNYKPSDFILSGKEDKLKEYIEERKGV
jgi:hypothetical protein